MAIQYLHVFNGSTEISNGDGSAPLTVGPLKANENEVSAPIALTLKVNSGFKTYGATSISFVGTTANKWSICATSDGTYGSTLSIPTEVTEIGTVFYVRAQATEDEEPSNDTSVDISVSSVIQAV